MTFTHNRLNYEFKYHNVGQGLFYSGKIDGFTFIYDCGSNSSYSTYLNHNIKSLKENMRQEIKESNRVIDLLVISHFDADHINGLDELLKDVKLKTVILPYLEHENRVYYALKSNQTKRTSEILMSPIEYFLEIKKIDRVLFIEQDYNLDETDDEKYNNNNYDNDYKIHEEYIDKQTDEVKEIHIDFTKMKINKKLERKLQTDEKINDYMEQGRIKAFTDEGYIVLNGVWKFIFFNFYDEKKKDLIKTLKEKYEIENREDINNLLRECEKRKEIKKEYKKLWKDLNDTSLVLLHRPIGMENNTINLKSVSEGEFNSPYYGELPSHNNIELRDVDMGQLLMGDGSIQNDIKYREFCNHFGINLEKVRYTLLPHHGSKKNWNNKFLEEYSDCNYYIASSGFSNRYSHPSLEIVLNIVEEKKVFCRCNEISQVKLFGQAYFSKISGTYDEAAVTL